MSSSSLITWRGGGTREARIAAKLGVHATRRAKDKQSGIDPPSSPHGCRDAPDTAPYAAHMVMRRDARENVSGACGSTTSDFFFCCSMAIFATLGFELPPPRPRPSAASTTTKTNIEANHMWHDAAADAYPLLSALGGASVVVSGLSLSMRPCAKLCTTQPELMHKAPRPPPVSLAKNSQPNLHPGVVWRNTSRIKQWRRGKR